MRMVLARLRRLPVDRWLLAASVGIFVAFFAVWLVVWSTSSSAFDVSARSEVVSLATGCRTQPRWVFQDATVIADGERLVPYTGQVEAGPASLVRIERVGSGVIRLQLRRDEAAAATCGSRTRLPLALLVQGATAGRDGGRFLDPEERAVETSLVIEATLAESSTLTLPFLARAEIGQSMQSATRTQSPMLLSGSVTFLRAPFFSAGSGLPYPAGGAELSPGDRFSVPESTDAGYGFVRVDHEAAMLVGYRATGKIAEVERFGTRSYSLAPTLAATFAGDAAVQIVLALIGGFSAIAQTLGALRDEKPATGGEVVQAAPVPAKGENAIQAAPVPASDPAPSPAPALGPVSEDLPY